MEKIIKLSAQPQISKIPDFLYKEKFSISTSEGTFIIRKSDIQYLKSMSNYCEIHLRNGERIFSSKTMKHFSTKLTSRLFCRVHNSYVVNLSAVDFIDTSYRNVKLNDGTDIPLARSRQDFFKRQLSLICD